jgi:hypothetical protein
MLKREVAAQVATADVEPAMEVDTMEHGHVSEQVATPGAGATPLSPNCLFWKMFQYFDTCPYCGGTFFAE